MTSIQTNAAAMSSLRSLAVTQRDMARVQSQVSTGLAVSVASDNAAYWTIGNRMSSQIAGLDAVDQGLALTQSIADVTAAALVAIKGAVDKIQNAVVAARQSGLDRSALQAEISAQQQSIIAIANGASFNGVNWLLNTLSSSESVTATIRIDTPRSMYDAVLLGQAPNQSSQFHSQLVDETTTTVNGVTASQTRTIVYDIRTTDAQDGTVSKQGGQTSDTTTGSADSSTFGAVSLPMSVSASGLSSSSFSLAPLTLFTDFAGGYSEQQTTTENGVIDPAYTHGRTTTTATSHSYDGYGGGAAPGILDPTVVTATGVPSWSASDGSGGSGGSSQRTVGIDITGGYVSTSNTGGSGGGAGSGPTATLFQESILDLDVVGLSADDLAAVEQGVLTALGSLTEASAVVGGLQTRVSNQQSYNAALVDSLTSGVGSLVDADMNVASTRLQALQARQQLGIQALSIANEDGRLVLKLFGAA